jgi:hypothetical protein
VASASGAAGVSSSSVTFGGGESGSIVSGFEASGGLGFVGLRELITIGDGLEPVDTGFDGWDDLLTKPNILLPFRVERPLELILVSLHRPEPAQNKQAESWNIEVERAIKSE